MENKKLWGKRFEKKPSALAEAFTSGRDVRGISPADQRLIPYDLWGSRAHVVMLVRQRIIPRRDARLLVTGLREIEKYWQRGSFNLDPSLEDVHTNVEGWLIEKFGIEVGGKLHTARSRNDQVALDMRLYLRDCNLGFVSGLSSLIQTLLRRAKEHRGVITPGYTHHQSAQVTTLGHIWLSFAGAFSRDVQRFQDWYNRFNENPLGSMTGYGTTFPIDRFLTSKLLGFDGLCENSLDPIQNRWEAEAELGFAVSAMMNHLSSLAQTLILFSTAEFGFVKLDDAYSTGSSMMPQKRNPDTLEVMKAKASAAQGFLASLLSIGKALFLGYNRDTQWTKYLILDLVDECLSAAPLMGEIISSLKISRKEMEARSQAGFIAAPELVEQMVQEWKIPFRQAKGAVEKAIRYAEKEGFKVLPLPLLQKASQEEGLKIKMTKSFARRSQKGYDFISKRVAVGGPSPRSLDRNISTLKRTLQEFHRWLKQKVTEQSRAKMKLARMEQALNL
ncbi:MAG TPA: argininosuccinate lyase [Thermodesulfobacteriota bacterium]|nr:argininosuccinate lyase [Thermodesulfobacteriota bacterium]